MLKREPNIVESIQQAMTCEFIHGKLRAKSLIVAHFAFLQVDRQLIIADLLRPLHQLRSFLISQSHGKKSILGAVVGENISERKRNHRAEAEVGQCPHRVLSRRSAAKIFSSDQNTCAFKARLVQHKVRVLRSVRLKPPVIKQKLSKARLFDPLQKLLGNNLVGIYVNAIQRRDASPMQCEWFHRPLRVSSAVRMVRVFLITSSMGASCSAQVLTSSRAHRNKS